MQFCSSPIAFGEHATCNLHLCLPLFTLCCRKESDRVHEEHKCTCQVPSASRGYCVMSLCNQRHQSVAVGYLPYFMWSFAAHVQGKSAWRSLGVENIPQLWHKSSCCSASGCMLLPVLLIAIHSVMLHAAIHQLQEVLHCCIAVSFMPCNASSPSLVALCAAASLNLVWLTSHSLACAAAGLGLMLIFYLSNKRAQSQQDNIERKPFLTWDGVAGQFLPHIPLAISIIATDYYFSAADAHHDAMWAHIGLVLVVYVPGYLLMACFYQGNQSVAA